MAIFRPDVSMRAEYNTVSVVHSNTRSVVEVGQTRRMARTTEESDFWRRLVQARTTAPRKLGVRQEDVARSTGKRQSAVTKWKTGKALPTTDTVRALALEANVSFDWLLTGAGTMRRLDVDADLDELVGYWRELDLSGRQHVLRSARLEWGARNSQIGQPETNHAGNAVHERQSSFSRNKPHR